MNAITDGGLLPAWSDPVHDAQAAFRCVLKALSEPGLRQKFPVPVAAPAPLAPATAALLLTLADLEAPVWLAEPFNTSQVRDWLRFHCGCPLVSERDKAQFAVLNMPDNTLRLDAFAQGSMEYPDQSASLLMQVSSLEAGPARVISGPGIPVTRTLHVAGLLPEFNAQWKMNQLAFPLGVDLVFCCGDAIVGLPRTTRIQSEASECM
ncbi:MAG: phosphonate C-P lyase system protein PhnH [Burkholderiales bacterium]|nr:phosphonate C-P lyase system protein PhnH [Burkholderiales bacterium]